MEQRERIRILKELLRQVDEKVNIDAGFQVANPTTSYTCPDLAREEWEHFFCAHPQLIGLSGDLPRPGSYITRDDFGVPLLATRDPEGRFRAFVNACRHRGARVATACRGESRHFLCPFHNWTYTSGGELVGVSRERDFGKVDRAQRGLVELPAAERHGLLWVYPRPGGDLDVDTLLGALGAELEDWGVGHLRFVGETRIEKRINWKLANDTFGETYHFSRLHRETLSNIFYSDAVDYRVFGRNHRFVFPARAIDSLRPKPEAQWSLEGVVTVLYYLFPNIQCTIGEHQVNLIRIYPHREAPGRSTTCISHYASPEAIAATEEKTKTVIDATNVYKAAARDGNAVFSPAAAMEVFNSTLEHEDYRVAETTQQVAESGALDHLLFGRNEPALHHYHNTFRSALGKPPLEPIWSPAERAGGARQGSPGGVPAPHPTSS